VLLPPPSGLNSDFQVKFSYLVTHHTIIVPSFQQGLCSAFNLADLTPFNSVSKASDSSRNTAPRVSAICSRMSPMVIRVKLLKIRKALCEILLENLYSFIGRLFDRRSFPNVLKSQPSFNPVVR
jgi:hypothetical protein